MNIQIYSGKKNFDTQKAERYFKERRIPFQAMDLKKHKLGEREIRLMLDAVGMEQLIDREDKKVREHPACYFNRADMLIPERKQGYFRIPARRMGHMGISAGKCCFSRKRMV